MEPTAISSFIQKTAVGSESLFSSDAIACNPLSNMKFTFQEPD